MSDSRQADRAAWEGEMFRLLAENVRGYAIFIIDPHRHILSWSTGAERLLGFTEEEIVGRQCDCFFTPEDVHAGIPQKELNEALRTGRGDDDRWHVRKDGTRFWAGGVVTPLRDEGGRLRGFAKIMRDRTDQKRAAEAARERERQPHPPADRAPVLIARCDADRRYTFVNTPYAAQFGRHPREVVGRSVRDVLGGPAYAAVERHMDAALAGERVEFDVEIPHAGQEPQALRCAYDPEFDAAGRVVGFVAAVVNVTESRRAGDALRASEERFARFMQHLPGLAWIKDDRGRYAYANDAAVAAFGVPRSDLYGRTDEAVFPPATAAQFRENDRTALAGGAGVRAVETLRHADGAVRHSLVSKFPIPGADGGPPLVGGMAIDITEETRTRAVLEESEERFRGTFDQAAVGIAHVGTDGRWLRVNRKLCDIVGYDPDELMRLTFQDITHPDDVDADLAQLRQLVAGEIDTYAMEKRYFRKDGRTVWINLTVALVRTPAGEPKYLISVIEDITGKKQVEDALRESERQYRTLFENMAEEVHYWRVERDGGGRIATWRLVDANPPALRTWGKSLADVRGRTTDEIFGPGSTDHYRAVVERVMAEGVPHSYEDYFPALDRHFRFTTVPVGDHFITTGADVTAARRAAEVVRESERRFRAIVTQATVGVAQADLAGRYTLANPRYCGLVGYSEAELLGMRMQDVTHPDDLPGNLERFHALAAGGPDFVVEKRYVRKDGSHVWVSNAVTAVRDPAGRLEGVLAVTVDLTDRRRAEAAVRESERRFREMADTAPVALWTTDPDGACTFLSREWYEFTGQTEAEALGLGWTTATHPDDQAHAGRVFLAANAARTTFRTEYRLRTRDGSYRWAMDIGRPRYSASGEYLGMVGAVFDLEDRRQAEQALKDADRRKDEFLATLAHELRNPLAPLRNGLQILRLSRADAAAAERAMGMMDRQLGQMVHLVDDLLDVSRITRGKLSLRRERVELAAVVQNAVEASRPLIEAAAHRLAVALPQEPVWLDADPTRLAQVLANLLTNAAKYTERGGDIRLTAERRAGEVVLSVTDTGIGISAEHLPRLFQMFSQVDSALERSQGGLGIGLALVRGLVEMHGGTVAARSEGRGKGSEFVVRLPVPAETAAGPAHATNGDGAVAARPHRRILVADDNRDAADSLAEMLRLFGHEVHTAHDGREAVEAAGWFRPEVALLDIGMPHLNGYEAARLIRGQSWGGRVVLVAVTGWGQEDDRRRASEAGFDAHLTKPVAPADLDRLLADLTRRG